MSTESFSSSLKCLSLESNPVASPGESLGNSLTNVSAGDVILIATRRTQPEQVATVLWETSSIPMVEWKLDGTIVDWNPAASALFGLKAEDAIGENLFRRLITDANSLQLKTLLQTKRNQLHNMKTLHSHGGAAGNGTSALLCEWNHSILSGQEGSQGGDRMISMITDITSYVQTKRDLKDCQKVLQQRTDTLHDLVEKYQSVLGQLALAQSNCAVALQDLPTLSEYQPILAACTDVMVVLDRHGIYQRILPTSPSPLFKLTQDWVGKSIRQLLPKNQADTLIETIQISLDNQQKSRLDYHFPMGETLIWFDAAISPIDRDCVLMVARNITDRHNTEEKLRLSEAFLHQVLDALPDPIFVKDELRRWKLVNQAACELIGHPRELIMGVTDQDLFPPEEVVQQREQDEIVLTLGMDSSSDTYLTDASGTQHFVSTKKTSFEDRLGKKFIVGSIRDLSDRKTMEDALRKSESHSRQQTLQLTQTLKTLQLAQSQLVQSEKMSSLGQLVAGVAHEINNPVNFIHGNVNYVRSYAQDMLTLLNLYQKYYPNPHIDIQDNIEAIDLDFIISDLNNVLRSMETGTERIQQIVRSLRIFSRMDEAEMKSVNIHEGLDSALMLLDSRLKAVNADIQVICHYDDLPDIECYAGQLNQVFMNILTNAIDAMASISLEQQREIQITTKLLNQTQVEIRIKDNGIGISDAEKQRLFDPFFTTKPIGKGTGMGLSICYQIITQHGGRLTCNSKLGEGAEFVIQIPTSLPA